MAESNTYTGQVSGTMYRDTYQKLTSADWFSKKVQWACFNKTAFLKAVGVEAFGVDAMKDLQAFGAAKPTGRIIRYDKGKYAVSGAIFATTPTGHIVGRMGNFTPELVEGGDEWSYAWHQLFHKEFIPDVDVHDNSAGIIDIKQQKMEGIKQKHVQDVNYMILGNSSAPGYSSQGPVNVYSDLPNLISVTQTRTVGGIAKTNAYWQNGYKAITSIGGGGELDRPLTLKRSIEDQINDQAAFAESTADYMFLATQGAYQYWGRLAYADGVAGGRGDIAVGNKYDNAGIKHYVISGYPLLFDPAVTIPYGATASTEAIYGIHIPTFFISIRSELNFKWSGWEDPREHDVQQVLVASMRTRLTPGVSAMRPHWCAYNLPANPD